MRNRKLFWALVALLVAGGGFGVSQVGGGGGHRATSSTTATAASATASTGSTSTAAPIGPVAKRSGCVSHGGLPDAGCTPGSTNPQVTQAAIGQTICVRGWTATVRPPVSVTGPIKLDRLAAYGLPAADAPFALSELDHLIPLELGGALADPANLWPELAAYGDGSPGYRVKDRVENALKADVCAGRVPLAQAQREIATDWVAAARARGLV